MKRNTFSKDSLDFFEKFSTAPCLHLFPFPLSISPEPEGDYFQKVSPDGIIPPRFQFRPSPPYPLVMSEDRIAPARS